MPTDEAVDDACEGSDGAEAALAAALAGPQLSTGRDSSSRRGLFLRPLTLSEPSQRNAPPDWRNSSMVGTVLVRGALVRHAVKD